ncbi:MAG TPA: S8 family serine peptidase [Gaiellaceae bacterium]|nr:S8 family serine peptidase [Gaiellaceae bacterium]
MRKPTFVAAVAALVLLVAPVAQGQTSEYIVVLGDGADVDAVVQEHAAQYGADVSYRYRHALRGYAAQLTGEALAGIRADARVLFVAENRDVGAAASCDPQAIQCLPSGVDRVDADLSSTAAGDGTGSVDVNVAVLDTGIDVTHPDLNVVGGFNCQDSSGFDDRNGHGTHVAGILGAKDNGFGVVGVAPGVRLWAVRVLKHSAKEKELDALVCGVDWVTSTRTDFDPTNDIAIANMSLGGPGEDDGNCGLTNGDPMHLAICNSVDAGVLYVVAGMNDGVDLRHTFPAAYDEVLTATAMWDSDGRAGGLNEAPEFPNRFSKFCDTRDDTYVAFSNFAVLPADRARVLAAPGVCIPSTLPGGKYEGYFSGTSMAAPHIAGTAALCIAAGDCTGSPEEVRQTLLDEAESFNLASPAYGFLGDPLHPLDPSHSYFGNHVGFLVNASLY